MTPHIADLFRRVVDLSPELRAQYLADHAVDAATRRELDELLAHDGRTGDRFSQVVGVACKTLLRPEAMGSRCGPFRLVSVLGRGGMGVVYLAERADGEVTQRAAVKLMQPGWSAMHRERFLREREILAALTHPNIAHLLDAGHTEDGQPYLAMEYVEGRPIHQHCEGLTIRQKIELFLTVCGAVSYLHSNNVVHRDLKPGNILVRAQGEPKLLDFGIARMQELGTDATVTHLRMLTPDYASPEQVSGGVVGTSSDIYSLGAVLHRLLTGEPPGDMRPSQLTPELKGDLEVILQAAMQDDAQERYATVEELAGDLKAWLDSRPIRARRGGLLYRGRKFVRRHRLTTTLAGALAIAVAGLGWYSSRSVPTVTDLRPRRITANTPELPIHGAAIAPDGKSIAYSDPLGIHLQYTASGETRVLPGTNGHVFVRWLPDGAGILTKAQRADGGTAMMIVSPQGGAPVPAPVSDFFRISPDKKRRASVTADGQRLLIRDASGGNSREVWRAAAKSSLDEFHWSPNGRWIAIVSSTGSTSILETVDVTSQKKVVLIPAAKKLWISAMVWPRANRLIVTISDVLGISSYNSNLWEVLVSPSGALVSGGLRKLTAWTDFPIRPGSLTTDGRRLVFVRSFMQRDVYVADVDASRSRMGTPRRLTLDLGDDYPTAWTRDSKAVILTSARNGPQAIFRQSLDNRTADQLVAAPGHHLLPRVTPDGRFILFLSVQKAQRSIQLVPVGGGTPKVLMDAGTGVADMRCSPAGNCTVALRQGKGYGVFELDLVKGKGREIYREAENRRTPDISPDGKWLAVAAGTKIVIRSFATGAVVREIPVCGATNLTTLDYAPDGEGFFSGETLEGEVRQLYVDLSGKTSILWRQAGSPGIWAVPSPNGRHLALMMSTDDSNVYTVDNI